MSRNLLRWCLSLKTLTCFVFSLFISWGWFATIPANAASSIQPYVDKVVERITEFQLDNGMKFIVLENHEAPVISFVTYADVGGVDEPDGKTGVAHFLEHLAFKGTEEIGTTNYRAEKRLLNRLDRLYDRIKAAETRGNQAEIEKLQEKFAKVQKKASEYVISNQLGQIIETAGGRGLNAATSADATVYFYSLPANKLELWMSLESERFLEPVFREFYKEKQVILEERRLAVDNSPIGKTIEVFLDKAFTEHPYKRYVIGYDRDIRNLERRDVKKFFKSHYPPNNLTVAIAGDVDPDRVKTMAKTYFGRYSAQPQAPEVAIVEPPQTETKEFTLRLDSQPWYFEGYHRPSITDPDHAVYEVISSLLSDGRTSRLYKSLVEEKQVALAARGISDFPGKKYPNLMLFYALTAPNSDVDNVAAALNIEIDRLKNESVSETELQRVKTNLRAGLLRSLDSNLGMAQSLVEYEALTGDWRNLFNQLDAIANVSQADIQRVARSTFTPENRTIGKLLPSSSS
ncbi:MAG: pitrilysin family protein [Prochloraceae cyanobacterium]|nr:pitrilysin family protein [Prochloraceae cyanobacterium]